MPSRLIPMFTFLALASASYAQNPNEPVGPVKPVEVVNETIRVEGSVDVSQVDPERFQIVVDLRAEPGTGFDREVLNIPAGKRLIIEHVSADVRTSDSQRAAVRLVLGPTTSSIGGSTTQFAVPYVFPLQDSDSRISTSPGARVWYLSESTELWADGYAEVAVLRGPSLDGPFPDLSGIVTARIAVSGRIVNAPIP